MANDTLGVFLSRLTEKASEKAKEQREQAYKDRDAEIGIYTNVLKDPNATPEQIQKATDALNKLYQVKKGESPFDKIGGFLQHLGKKQQQP